MQIIRLLSRVAFICNICFLLASLILWLPNPPEGALISMLIIMGTMLALFVGAIVNGWVIILVAMGSVKSAAIPIWLIVINFVAFALELLSLILNNR